MAYKFGTSIKPKQVKFYKLTSNSNDHIMCYFSYFSSHLFFPIFWDNVKRINHFRVIYSMLLKHKGK